ncbi:MAG: hypothetical protein O2931_18165 [Planctomycetota bacterium]|nr:hypothetical protein [Planctomycetota bacterium]
MPVVLPLLGVWMAVLFARCVRNQMRIMGVAKSYREPCFRPTNEGDLDSEVGELLDLTTERLLELGFRKLGDYQTKSDPVAVYNRYLSGFGGTIFGDITLVIDEFGIGFMSVLEDGTYVESAATDPYAMSGEVTPSDFLSVNLAGRVTPADLLEVHLLALERECKSRHTRVLLFGDGQLADVSVYGQRRFWTWRKRCGENTGDVPSPVLPVGKAVNFDEIRAGDDGRGNAQRSMQASRDILVTT